MRTNQVSTGTAMAQAVSELGDLLARIAALTEAGALTDLALADLPDVTRSLARHTDQLEGITAAAVARVHKVGVLPVTTVRWLQNEAGMTASGASAVVVRACALEESYPATRAAWIAGGITRAHASIITAAVDKVARTIAYDKQAEFRAMAERGLLGYSLEGASPGDLAIKARRVRAWADAAGMAADAAEIERAQFIRFVPEEGGVTVHGFLSPESHALIATALEQAIDLRHRQGTLPEEDRNPGDDPPSARARRMRQPYLNVIALRDVCGALLEEGALGSRHGAIPRVSLDVDLHDLHSAFGGILRSPGHDHGTVIGHASVRRLLCDAEVSAAIVTGARPRCTCGCPSCGCTESGPSLDDLLRDAAKDVLYVGRAHRVVPPRLRRALEVRDRGRCTHPGCGVPASRCRAHHVRHWEDGGLTDLDNCVLVCERHHHDLHEGGWSLAVTPGKRPDEYDYLAWVPPSSRRRP